MSLKNSNKHAVQVTYIKKFGHNSNPFKQNKINREDVTVPNNLQLNIDIL